MMPQKLLAILQGNAISNFDIISINVSSLFIFFVLHSISYFFAKIFSVLINFAFSIFVHTMVSFYFLHKDLTT